MVETTPATALRQLASHMAVDWSVGGAGSYVDGSRRGAHRIRVMQDYYG